eukprot:SAG11_NODE_3638_length_2320_cov_2.063935_1_plen_196_part_01
MRCFVWLPGRKLTPGEEGLSRIAGPGLQRGPNHPWELVCDEQGEWIYHNATTGQMQVNPPVGWQPDANEPWVRTRRPDGWEYANRETGETQQQPPDDWEEQNDNHPYVRVQRGDGSFEYANVETGATGGTAPAGWVDVPPLTQNEEQLLRKQLSLFYAAGGGEVASTNEVDQLVQTVSSMLNAGLARKREAETEKA